MMITSIITGVYIVTSGKAASIANRLKLAAVIPGPTGLRRSISFAAVANCRIRLACVLSTMGILQK